MVKKTATNDGPGYVSKKCHECYTYVPLNAEVCPDCKTPLGKLGAHGMAEKTTDWHAYIKFAIALVVFLAFCKYAFF